MTMNEEFNKSSEKSVSSVESVFEKEESSIDFGKIFKDLLKHKRLYYKVLPVAFVLAAINIGMIPLPVHRSRTFSDCFA